MYNPQQQIPTTKIDQKKKSYQSNGQIGFQLKKRLGVDEEERFLSPNRDAEKRRRSVSVD
jgi:hypothetical protein